MLLQCRFSETGGLAWLSMTCETNNGSGVNDTYRTGDFIKTELVEDSVIPV